MRISDWSSDVCSSDLADVAGALGIGFDTFDNTGGTDHNTISIHLDGTRLVNDIAPGIVMANGDWTHARLRLERTEGGTLLTIELTPAGGGAVVAVEDYFLPGRSEEHTSELQSLMRISYSVFCLKKKK